MKQEYIATISVTNGVSKESPQGYSSLSFDVKITSDSKEHAEKRVMKYCKRKFPVKRGWSNHTVVFKERTQ